MQRTTRPAKHQARRGRAEAPALGAKPRLPCRVPYPSALRHSLSATLSLSHPPRRGTAALPSPRSRPRSRPAGKPLPSAACAWRFGASLGLPSARSAARPARPGWPADRRGSSGPLSSAVGPSRPQPPGAARRQQLRRPRSQRRRRRLGCRRGRPQLAAVAL